MKGRVENENRIDHTTQSLLEKMPVFVKEWYYNLKANEMTASSCYLYLNKIKNMIDFYDTPVNVPADLTQLKTIEFFNSTKIVDGKETSISLRQWVWTAMNNLFTYLVNTKAISYNYMNTIKRPRNKNQDTINSQKTYLTITDFNKILKAVDNKHVSGKAKNMASRDKLIIYLFMTTGMRRTALSSIDISDIDFEKQQLTVVDKGSKLHVYDLNDVLMDMLDVWLKERKEFLGDIELDALFVSERKRRLESASIYPIIEKYSGIGLGYNISPHKLRAGFCSIMYNKTHDIEFVRRVVGHNNVQTTQRYIITNNKERKEASGIMESLLRV